MKKIYLLTSGEYSDYSVNYVCTDEGVADAVIDKFNRFVNDSLTKEVFTVTESAEDIKFKTAYTCTILASGEVSREDSYTSVQLSDAPYNDNTHVWYHTTYEPGRWGPDAVKSKEFAFTCSSTKSAEAARKGASDKRAWFLSEFPDAQPETFDFHILRT